MTYPENSPASRNANRYAAEARRALDMYILAEAHAKLARARLRADMAQCVANDSFALMQEAWELAAKAAAMGSTMGSTMGYRGMQGARERKVRAIENNTKAQALVNAAEAQVTIMEHSLHAAEKEQAERVAS